MQKSVATVLLASVVACAAAFGASACGSSNNNSGFPNGNPDAAGDGTSGGDGALGDGGVVHFGDGSGEAGVSGAVLSNAQIVPANAALTVQAGKSATQTYKVMGSLDGSPTLTD